GEYEDDDEVAVSHASTEYGFRTVSEAMVNLRWGLELAESAGILSSASRSRLTALAKDCFYRDRSWFGLFALGSANGLPGGELQALRDFVERARPNRKRDDAVMALERVRGDM